MQLFSSPSALPADMLQAPAVPFMGSQAASGPASVKRARLNAETSLGRPGGLNAETSLGKPRTVRRRANWWTCAHGAMLVVVIQRQR